MFVFSNESPEKWTALLQIWTDKLQPRDEAEASVVLDIAHAQWKLRRARTYESGLMDSEMEEQAEDLAKVFNEVDEGIRQASAFKSLADNSRSLDLLHRYETRARRAFERGLTTLERLRKLAPDSAPLPEREEATRPESPSAPEVAQGEENEASAPAAAILQNEMLTALPVQNKNLQNEIVQRFEHFRQPALSDEEGGAACHHRFAPDRDCAVDPHRLPGL